MCPLSRLLERNLTRLVTRKILRQGWSQFIFFLPRTASYLFKNSKIFIGVNIKDIIVISFIAITTLSMSMHSRVTSGLENKFSRGIFKPLNCYPIFKIPKFFKKVGISNLSIFIPSLKFKKNPKRWELKFQTFQHLSHLYHPTPRRNDCPHLHHLRIRDKPSSL